MKPVCANDTATAENILTTERRRDHNAANALVAEFATKNNDHRKIFRQMHPSPKRHRTLTTQATTAWKNLGALNPAARKESRAPFLSRLGGALSLRARNRARLAWICIRTYRAQRLFPTYESGATPD